jgi:hypothetical protein
MNQAATINPCEESFTGYKGGFDKSNPYKELLFFEDDFAVNDGVDDFCF